MADPGSKLALAVFRRSRARRCHELDQSVRQLGRQLVVLERRVQGIEDRLWEEESVRGFKDLVALLDSLLAEARELYFRLDCEVGDRKLREQLRRGEGGRGDEQSPPDWGPPLA
jgi:hypothetical protein